MTSRDHSIVVWVAAWVAVVGAAGIVASADRANPVVPPKIASSPRQAIEPAAPLVLPEVVAALQAGQYDDAPATDHTP